MTPLYLVKTAPRCLNSRGHDPRSRPLSDDQSTPKDCGKKGHARAGCDCDRCVRVRKRETDYGRRWNRENAERVAETRRNYYAETGGESWKKYEKTPKGYLVRSYRNMLSRVRGIQKPGSWTGKEILPKQEFYEWALADPTFHRLFQAYEASGYDRRLAPSPDRIDSAKGYTLDNMRWLTHSENSALASRGRKKDAA